MAVESLISGARRLLFAVAVLAFFLVGAEAVLRLLEPRLALTERAVIPVIEPAPDRRPPYPPPATEACDELLPIRPPHLALNRLGGPVSPADCLQSTVSAPGSGKRIFIVGGSAAWGDGVEYAQTFAGLLAERLDGANVTVFNAARNGQDSQGVARTAARILACHAPNLLVVMTGNNEWLNWRPRPEVPLRQRLHQTLGKSQLYRLLILGVRKTRQWRKNRAADRGELAGFNENRGCETFRSLREPAGFDPQRWRVDRGDTLKAFRHNLEQIIALAKENRVPVLLVTMPVRTRLCPAYFVEQPHASFCPENRRLAGGMAALREGAAGQALQSLAALAEACPETALPPYFAGRAAEALGDRRLAAAFYRRAREATVGNLGSMASINLVVRQTAEETGTALVDADELFRRAYRDPLESDRLFLDFCHIGAEGHRMLAEALWSEIQSLPAESR